ncbi:AAA family ATPase [Hydrogenophaga sp.]|uniref:bifunctional aminoglycoside phosphotransferase/ATP-binding protein n=1 Tax=Hydrogenophaga sp. TaxID=1904254 RepID=UPI0025799D69|nr:AAA family ATPase [Hydrogenophaga sp.]
MSADRADPCEPLADGGALARALAARLGATLIETHISWVLLAGEHAFKLKKPLRLPFVDYGTLAARRHCCEQELRLNRRLAPSLYLDVVAITGPCEAPVIGGEGPAIEYAVRMRRFPEGALFSERLAAQRLGEAEIDACAALLARFHRQAPVARTDSGFASAAHRAALASAALEGAAPLASAEEAGWLARWLRGQAQRLAPHWAERLAGGHVRECHGDLHLANLIVVAGEVSAFDGIEFDPALRWIDVIDDIAFPVMDLHAQGRGDLAFRLLNAWLDASGEHAGLPGLRHALVYRALVRAQVERLRGRNGPARRYLDAALRWARHAPPWLALMHGLPGSGKSFVSQQVLQAQGAIRLRSDVERKRLFGLQATEDSRASGLDIYGGEATRRTYDRLFALAGAALGAGWPVILDAAFLRRHEREAAAALARQAHAPWRIVHCEAAPEVLRARLRARRGDASEADEGTLGVLQAAQEPLTPQEWLRTEVVPLAMGLGAAAPGAPVASAT